MHASDRSLHVIIVNAGYIAEPRDPDIFLNRHVRLTGWAQALDHEGVHVHVCQRFHRRADRKRDEVNYRFIAGPAQGLFRGAARIADDAAKLAHQLCRRGDVVVHVNGLRYPLAVGRLARRLPRSAALLLQHRSEQPGSALHRAVQRRAFRRVDGYFFSHRDLAEPWRSARVVADTADVHQLMETSSTLTPVPPMVARQRHGMAGNPVVLWAGRLQRDKDPLTVLRGFRRFVDTHPEAHLYMVFRNDDLRPVIEAECAASPALASTVSILGERPYSSMHTLFSAADIFIQGNRRDENSLGTLDAMACGAVPVVTNLPTFRAMLGERDGEPEVGALWEPGDAENCAAALCRVADRALAGQQHATRMRFEKRWCWSALAVDAVRAYRSAVVRRLRLTGPSHSSAVVHAGSAS
jgi:glycosyltransferase involved in cell wall biosynthesis